MKTSSNPFDAVYRGKRLDNGEWVYGYLVCDTEFYGEPDFHCYIVDNKHPSGCFGSDIYKEVDPATVGRCTGVKDKNGVEIYEGDIVTGVFWFGMAVHYTVGFQDGAFGLCWTWNGVEHFGAFTSFCNVEYTVIGDIYDGEECDHDCDTCEERAICNASTYKPE